jgi:hypothetical protein
MTLSLDTDSDISHNDDALPTPSVPTKKTQPRRIDMTGQTFPCGTVVEFAQTGRKRAHWKVQCRFCGAIFIACGRALRKGNPPKCHCQKFDPNYLVGKPFGRGVVRARAGAVEYNGEAIWELECSCEAGRSYRAKTSDLTSGNVVSCGCWRKERMAEMNRTRARERHGLLAPLPEDLAPIEDVLVEN